MAVIIPALVGLGISGYQVYQGEKAKKEAKKAQAANTRPVYDSTIPQGEFDALSLLGSRAGQGLSDSAKNLFTQNADRQLTSQIDAILKSGGDPNDISNVGQNYADSISRLSLAEDAAKLQNVNAYLAQQRRVNDMQGESYDTAFQINEYAPFVDEQKRIAQMRSMGQQQTNAGISTAGQAIGGYAAGISQKNDIARVNGGTVNWLGQTQYPSTATNGMGAFNNVTNNFAGTVTPVPDNYGYKPYSTSDMLGYSSSSGYDWSSLSPSARMELSQLLGGSTNNIYV